MKGSHIQVDNRSPSSFASTTVHWWVLYTTFNSLQMMNDVVMQFNPRPITELVECSEAESHIRLHMRCLVTMVVYSLRKL